MNFNKSVSDVPQIEIQEAPENKSRPKYPNDKPEKSDSKDI